MTDHFGIQGEFKNPVTIAAVEIAFSKASMLTDTIVGWRSEVLAQFVSSENHLYNYFKWIDFYISKRG